MTLNVKSERLQRFVLEAVPTSHGQYQAVFRVHHDGALSSDDEVHFGEVLSSPLEALEGAKIIATRYLQTKRVAG